MQQRGASSVWADGTINKIFQGGIMTTTTPPILRLRAPRALHAISRLPIEQAYSKPDDPVCGALSGRGSPTSSQDCRAVFCQCEWGQPASSEEPSGRRPNIENTGCANSTAEGERCCSRPRSKTLNGHSINRCRSNFLRASTMVAGSPAAAGVGSIPRFGQGRLRS